MPWNDVALENFGNGALAEKFNAALQAIAENIQDPNTDPTAAREITIKVKLKPDHKRENIGVELLVTTKPAADASYSMQLCLTNAGQFKQLDQADLPLFGDDAAPKTENVLSITSTKESVK